MLARSRGDVRRLWTIRALPVLIVVYGALLRFDALTQCYGPVALPSWVSVAQQVSAPTLRALHPAPLSWSRVPLYPHRNGTATRYFSDPYTYLQVAREMHGFAGASAREPIFPFVTRLFLTWLHDQDVAVSFASAAFSILGIAATYLLGAAAFGRAVGVIAGAALAIEYDVITWDVAGWRDDAFLVAIVLFAYALVRFLKASSLLNAGVIGLTAAVASLVRLTSISFIFPCVIAALLAADESWPRRSKYFGVVVLAMTIIAGPYIVNCWRVFGDPLYSINTHTNDQLVIEARLGLRPSDTPKPAAPTALGYVRAKFASRPIDAIDTLAIGMTEYPFQNKWSGFDRWAAWLGGWLAVASAAGIILFAGSATGRLLLLLLATSLVPFAATWKVAADWRFTEYTYPFFLVAAGLAVDRAVAGLVRVAKSPRAVRVAVLRPASLFWLAPGGVILLMAWVIVLVLPQMTVREALNSRDDAMIVAGARDGAFFRGGWRPARQEGNVTFRLTAGEPEDIRLPLPRVEDYDLTIRLDPFPRPPSEPLPTIEVFLNGQLVANAPMRWDPTRVGAYEVRAPKAFVRAGDNRLTLTSSDPARAIGVWYVRIRPPRRLG